MQLGLNAKVAALVRRDGSCKEVHPADMFYMECVKGTRGFSANAGGLRNCTLRKPGALSHSRSWMPRQSSTSGSKLVERRGQPAVLFVLMYKPANR